MIVGSSSESCKRYKSNPTEWPTEKSGRKNYLPFSVLLHSFSCPWSISYLSSTTKEAGSKFGIFIASTFGIEPFSSTSHAQAHAPCQPFAGNTLQIALEPLPLVECPTQMNLVALDKYKKKHICYPYDKYDKNEKCKREILPNSSLPAISIAIALMLPLPSCFTVDCRSCNSFTGRDMTNPPQSPMIICSQNSPAERNLKFNFTVWMIKEVVDNTKMVDTRQAFGIKI